MDRYQDEVRDVREGSKAPKGGGVDGLKIWGGEFVRGFLDMWSQ